MNRTMRAVLFTCLAAALVLASVARGKDEEDPPKTVAGGKDEDAPAPEPSGDDGDAPAPEPSGDDEDAPSPAARKNDEKNPYPYICFEWNVTYGDIRPLGVPEQAIFINGKFPGPEINCTTNDNIVVNVFNNLDEPFLVHWHGFKLHKNSWQDGLPGTNCPIKPGTNFTYNFQVKDQIGTYMYYPSSCLHRAAGGFGVIRVHSGPHIHIPYHPPAEEFNLLIGDWYRKNHTVLRESLDKGKGMGKPNGVLINGKNSKYEGEMKPILTMNHGSTYMFRVCNAGLQATMNLRFQNHTFKIVETEGTHTVQNEYESMDVHIGQCFSLLVNADKVPMEYKLVVSSRMTKNVQSTIALIQYEGATDVSKCPLAEAPVGWAWSLNQFRSFRSNITANGPCAVPQGACRYGSVKISRTIKLVSSRAKVDDKLRYAINGISHKDPKTPLKLAEHFGACDKVFKYDSIKDEPPKNVDDSISKVTPNVMKQTFRGFVEIIFENHEKVTQSWHLDGHSFFIVGLEPGTWCEEKRQLYNPFDAVFRNTVQVFPKCWAAIVVTFDNAGMWNLRSEILERQYLGQQMYFSVLSPDRLLKDEYNMPDNIILCGIVEDMPKPEPYKY